MKCNLKPAIKNKFSAECPKLHVVYDISLITKYEIHSNYTKVSSHDIHK